MATICILLLHVVLGGMSTTVVNAIRHLVLDENAAMQFARDTGVSSLLEREGHDMSAGSSSASAQLVLDIPALGASSQDVQARDFEIKCATKCGFVKSGAAEFAGSLFGGATSGAGEAAIKATQILENYYLEMAQLQDKIAADPDNHATVEARQSLQAKIDAQVVLLNSIAGGGAFEASASPDAAARLEELRFKLDHVTARLNNSPDDKALLAMRDQLRNEVADRKHAIDAEQQFQKQRIGIAARVREYDKELRKLKSQAGALPNDARLKADIERIEKAKERAQSSHPFSNPSQECLDICAKSKSPSSANSQCVVTCVTTMRAVSYKLAKLFL
jgi:hypothetical protein